MLKWLVWEINSQQNTSPPGEVPRRPTYVSDVDTGDTAPAVIPHALNHLVQDFARICLGADRHLEPVHPPLGVLPGGALEGDVGPAAVVAQLLEPANHGGLVRDAVAQGLEVDQLELILVLGGPLARHDAQARLAVDEDDLGRALVDSENSRHLADGPGAEDGDLVARVDGRVLDAVVRRGQHVRQVQGLLVGHAVRDGQQVDVTQRHAHVLGLPAGVPAREVRVPQHARRLPAVHCPLRRIGVGPLALRRQLLVAVEAVPARDLERRHVPPALRDALDL